MQGAPEPRPVSKDGTRVRSEPYSPKCVEDETREVRKDHSFGVCAAPLLANTIISSLSRPPLIPLEDRRIGFSLVLPRPDAPGTPPPRLSYVQIGIPAELYISTIMPDDMGISSPAPWPIGVGRCRLSRQRELPLHGVLMEVRRHSRGAKVFTCVGVRKVRWGCRRGRRAGICLPPNPLTMSLRKCAPCCQGSRLDPRGRRPGVGCDSSRQARVCVHRA